MFFTDVTQWLDVKEDLKEFLLVMVAFEAGLELLCMKWCMLWDSIMNNQEEIVIDTFV